ncbi:MAG: peptide chain release factor N(5)-glutamine methyltransferase, partial [Burkholderiales bacterium]|nr:peptide chain release factor N(5)-glutamine methyltransferase [Burkholderiales bacterium]
MRLAEALAAARTAGIARLDAQLLLGHLLGRPRAWLIAHDDTELDPAQTEALRQAFERRAAGVPLAYLTGEREFHGLVFRVGPAVLVPRPETEILVDWALELLAGGPAEVADLGTGSGAIAIALLHRNRCAHVCASDASPAALAQAGANARRLGVDVEFVAGDWWQPLAGRYFDLVVSNPPYVAGNEPHLEALAHEPRAALTPE